MGKGRKVGGSVLFDSDWLSHAKFCEHLTGGYRESSGRITSRGSPEEALAAFRQRKFYVDSGGRSPGRFRVESRKGLRAKDKINRALKDLGEQALDDVQWSRNEGW